MNHEVLQQASEIVDAYTKEILQRDICKVEGMDGGEGTIDGICEVLKEANKTIRWACGTNDELYEDYRYRLFQFNNKFNIVQGKELDVT